MTLYDNGDEVITRKLDGHWPLVRSINDLVVTTSNNGNLAVLNRKLELLKSINGSAKQTTSLAVSAQFAAFGNKSGTITFYDTTRGLVKSFYHNQSVTSVDVQNEYVVSGCTSGEVLTWNMNTSTHMFQFQHEDKVTCVKIVNRLIVTSSWDTTARVWSLDDGRHLKKFCHPNKCFNFDINDKKTLLAVVHGSFLTIWNFLKGGTFKLSQIELASMACDVRFNELGKVLVVGLRDGTLYKISSFDDRKSKCPTREPGEYNDLEKTKSYPYRGLASKSCNYRDRRKRCSKKRNQQR